LLFKRQRKGKGREGKGREGKGREGNFKGGQEPSKTLKTKPKAIEDGSLTEIFIIPAFKKARQRKLRKEAKVESKGEGKEIASSRRT